MQDLVKDFNEYQVVEPYSNSHGSKIGKGIDLFSFVLFYYLFVRVHMGWRILRVGQ